MRSIGIACTALALAASCVSSVRAPEQVEDPLAVHLFTGGRHTALVLPNAEGELVEFGYGSWSWYALGKDECWRAPAAVLWPNAGTLGRRVVRGGLESVTSGELRAISVPREAALRLSTRLEAEFQQGGEPHYSALYDMWFVRHADRFWAFHDCHDEVAEWLEELGCSVSGACIRTGLRVAE